jgi:hypothetical protein
MASDDSLRISRLDPTSERGQPRQNCQDRSVRLSIGHHAFVADQLLATHGTALRD